MAKKPKTRTVSKPAAAAGSKKVKRPAAAAAKPAVAKTAARKPVPRPKTGVPSAAPVVIAGKPKGAKKLPAQPVPKASPLVPVEESEDDGDSVPPEAEIPAVVEVTEPSALVPAEEIPAPSEGVQTALSSYMREVERYPILSREEEHEVARKFRETQDPELAKKLITSNLKLVVKIAWEYHNAYKNILDLVQEGNIGLMMAVKNFDPFQGVRLSSYAQYWIRAYILRYLVNSYHLVKLGTTQAQRKLFFNLRKEKAQLEREGFVPTAKLLAERLDVKESEVAEMDQRLSQGEVSLDAPLGPDTDMSLGDTLTGGEQGADDRLADKERMERFRAAMNAYRATLEERDALIFDKRLDTDSPITLQELGDQFSISKERARQLEERIKLNFRKFLDQNKDKYAI